MTTRIPPRSGTAFELKEGQLLTVFDPEGEQVSDLVAFNAHDRREYLSSGRSIDYAGRMFLSTDDILYSNRSVPMLTIVEDEVGRHDFSLTPCSRETFSIIYGDEDPHHGCQGNLEMALAPYGIGPDAIPIAFNVFMHVAVDSDSGEIKVLPPKSKPGEKTVFRAEMDLVVAMTACSAGQSNNFRYKPIDYRVSAAA
ncbi:MAG: urea carboxylase-associated family protein [Hoeflea sp.]|nr:urea carboxylase-associated family protein [Hoeflea sp.]